MRRLVLSLSLAAVVFLVCPQGLAQDEIEEETFPNFASLGVEDPTTNVLEVKSVNRTSQSAVDFAAALYAPPPVFVGGLLPPSAMAADNSDTEYQLKAAFLYNFTNFIEWPASRFEKKNSPIVIGVVGEDPFGEILEKTFRGRRVGRRAFKIVRFDDHEKLADCHLLFVPGEQKKHFPHITRFCKARSTLLVTEGEGFIGAGSIVNFFIEKKAVRFEIQIDEAKRAKLKISSKLLKLARVVRDRKDDGRRESP